MKSTLSLLAVLAVAGCSMAPDYAPPPSPQVTDYKELDGWKPASPSETAPKGQWWLAFGDPGLNALEDRVAPFSPVLQAGVARLAQARAVAAGARADLFPQVGATASGARLGRSQTVRPEVQPLFYNSDTLGLDVSYEVDLWGRVKNSIAAAEAEADASAADLAVLELAVRTELATDYFAVAGADTSLQVLEQTIAEDQAALDLVTRRHAGGVAAAADVAQARAQLELAKTANADLRLKRAQLEHGVALLVGQPPASLHLPVKPLTTDPMVFLPGQPSSLLERRPDVAAAERRVAEANARIGVTEAAWFPVFDLGAMAGLASGSPGSWMQASSAVWAVGPGALAQTIFDGGRRRAASNQALRAHDEALANYTQVTLTAWREVEDQVAALKHLESEAHTQQNAVDASLDAAVQARYRYQAGIVTYLDVVVSQNTLLAAQLTAADITLRRITADILLIKALGGGWKG